MPPSPIPAPLPPWAKALLQVLPFISTYLADLLEHIGEMKDATAADQNSWRHCSIITQRELDTDTADYMLFSFDIANITGGALDSSWTDADYTAVMTPLNAFLASLETVQSNNLVYKEARFYRRAFNPMTMTDPFAKSGPPEKVFPLTVPRTGPNTYSIPQAAMALTEITTYPKHWGRTYIPAIAAGHTLNTGYIDSGTVDWVVSGAHDLYQAWQNAEFFPVVPVTQVSKVATRGLLTVTAVQSDNVPDVVRRRRPHLTTYRHRLPIT